MNDRIKELESLLSDPDTDEKSIINMAKELDKLEPGNPLAALAMWESMDDEEATKEIHMLKDALEAIRPKVEKCEHLSVDEDNYASAYAVILNYLACHSLMMEEDLGSALDYSKELINFDDEGFFPTGRIVYYTALLRMEEYDRIIEESEADTVFLPIIDHAASIACLEQGHIDTAYDALEAAFTSDPEIPLYVMGFKSIEEYEFNEDYPDDENARIMQMSLLTEEWFATEERTSLIGLPACVYGFLTRRISDEKFLAPFRDGLKEMGIAREVEELKIKSDNLFKSNAETDDIDEEIIPAVIDLFRSVEDEN